jgi:FAS-associated factor 1
VHFNNTLHSITISNLKTVKDLKEAISLKTLVPVCRQLIKGWPKSTHKEAHIDTTVLRSLNLSPENNVFLTDLTEEGFPDDVMIVSSDPFPMYQLRIRYINEDKELNLNFPATKTVIEIKNDIYAVLKVPVRHQVWTGWPSNVSNTMKLSETGFNAVHSLTLTRSAPENNFNHDA